MAFTFIKFPKKFLDSEEWQKPRKYSKAEALLYLLHKGEYRPSIRQLADLWGWKKSTVQDFVSYAMGQGYIGQSSDKVRTQSGVSTNELHDCTGQHSDKIRTHNKEHKNYPPVLSTTNVVSNTIPPRGEENTDFIRFNEWINENAPRVAKMKEPFTAEQVAALKTDFEITFICDLLKAMHNYQPLLTKNRNAYLTFRNWARRETQKTNDTKRTTNTPSNDPKSRLEGVLRAAAEGISRANTPQEW